VRGTTSIPGVCVLIRKNRKGLFALRSNTGFKDGQYCVPGGHVEVSETFRQAARREVLEETGLHVRPEDLVYKLTVHRNSGKDIRIDVWFEAMAWTGEPKNGVPHEHSEITWLDLDNLPDNIADFIAVGLENIAEDQAYAEFGWS